MSYKEILDLAREANHHTYSCWNTGGAEVCQKCITLANKLDAYVAERVRAERLDEAEWWIDWYGDPQEVKDSEEAQEHLTELRRTPSEKAASGDGQ